MTFFDRLFESDDTYLSPKQIERMNLAKDLGIDYSDPEKNRSLHNLLPNNPSKRNSDYPLSGIDKTAEGYKINHKGSEFSVEKDLHKRKNTDFWNVKDANNSRVGWFQIQKPGENHYGVTVDKPTIRNAEIYTPHKGTGLGKKVYTAFAKHYGSLDNDIDSVSPDAAGVYRSLNKIGWSFPLGNKAFTGAERHRIKIPNITSNAKKLKALRNKSVTENSSFTRIKKVIPRTAIDVPDFDTDQADSEDVQDNPDIRIMLPAVKFPR